MNFRTMGTQQLEELLEEYKWRCNNGEGTNARTQERNRERFEQILAELKIRWAQR